MKKIIGLLLAMVMCLSLVACGGDNKEVKQETTENETKPVLSSEIKNDLLGEWFPRFEDSEGAVASIKIQEENSVIEIEGIEYTWEYVGEQINESEERNYYDFLVLDENGDVLPRESNIGDNKVKFTLSYHKDEGIFLSLFWNGDSAPIYDKKGIDNTANAENTEISETEYQYETVEITLDNWQDYFEFREHTEFKENGFGEFEKFINYYSLSCKDGLIIDADNSDVTVEYSYSQEVKPYTVDFENRTVKYGEVTETYTMSPEVESMDMKTVHYLGEDMYQYGIGEFEINSYSYLEGDNACIITNFKVTRITGNLYIAK